MKDGDAHVILPILPSGCTSDFSFFCKLPINFLFVFPSACVSPLPRAHFLPPAASCPWSVRSDGHFPFGHHSESKGFLVLLPAFREEWEESYTGPWEGLSILNIECCLLSPQQESGLVSHDTFKTQNTMQPLNMLFFPRLCNDLRKYSFYNISLKYKLALHI